MIVNCIFWIYSKQKVVPKSGYAYDGRSEASSPNNEQIYIPPYTDNTSQSKFNTDSADQHSFLPYTLDVNPRTLLFSLRWS